MSAVENSVHPGQFQAFKPEGSMSTDARLPEVATDWGAKLGRTQAEIQTFFFSAYRRSLDASRSLAREVGHRAARVRQEQPILLLSIIAGSAFLAGVGIAVWKTRR